MSDGTPTIGELERRIADLEARGEEWDEEIGMVDGEPSPARETVQFGREGQYEGNFLYTDQDGYSRVYVDEDGDYWLTSTEILDGHDIGLCVDKPATLRKLADKIEEVEQ